MGVVELLSFLLFQKVAAGILLPFSMLWTWIISGYVCNQTSVQWIRERFLRRKTLEWFSDFNQSLLLATWWELSLIWGPLIPALQLLLLLALVGNLLVYQIGTQRLCLTPPP